MRPTPIIFGLLLAGLPVVYLGLPLWLSGDWRWVEGWIFGIWFVSFAAAVLLWLRSRGPALLAERFRMPGTGGQSRADAAIVIGLKVCWLAFFVVPPLDVRFGWTPRLPGAGETSLTTCRQPHRKVVYADPRCWLLGSSSQR